LPTQMFPRLPARATFVADTNFVSGTQKMFLILFRNILCPQQHSFCVPRVCAPKKHHGQQCAFTHTFNLTRLSLLVFPICQERRRPLYKRMLLLPYICLGIPTKIISLAVKAIGAMMSLAGGIFY